MGKLIAYYRRSMKPNPNTPNIDGMWITREPPYNVVKVWMNDSERPSLSEEPQDVRGYSAYMARQMFDFEPDRKARVKKSLVSRV